MRPAAYIFVFGISSLLAVHQAWAGTMILCPDISQARQLAACPSEGEIKAMFKSGCGFERDPKAKEPNLCDTFAEFSRQKNIALWESADGQFMSYVTCNIPAEEVKTTELTGVAVSYRNELYKMSCSYQGGVTFTFRTRSVCRVPGVKFSMAVARRECGPDPSSCPVECD